ncbi:hypothetical protein HPP92_000794 [Vanilla planifolia]|uniref:O-methyltransferase C-terminal domain-containing protein n=1 Tax=Vanilla planifolia TaxID=51239 RepID=A0A835VGB4_VANPL|nr:hypothetical protein HPP92_000794 [Vanilla planifolia]
MSLFDYTAKDVRFNALFNDAMKGHTHIIMNKVMESYLGFHNVDVVVDIGGGLGSTLKMIVERYPHIKGINFDLPHVVSQAAPIPGVEHVGGDMFDAIPSGDLILMKWILHDWSDESSIKVLKNCRNSLHKNGKVVIVEYIIPDEPRQTSEARVVFHADMIMLAHNPGGKERKEEEFKTLAKKSGFSLFNSQYFYANACVMEFIK